MWHWSCAQRTYSVERLNDANYSFLHCMQTYEEYFLKSQFGTPVFLLELPSLLPVWKPCLDYILYCALTTEFNLLELDLFHITGRILPDHVSYFSNTGDSYSNKPQTFFTASKIKFKQYFPATWVHIYVQFEHQALFTLCRTKSRIPFATYVPCRTKLGQISPVFTMYRIRHRPLSAIHSKENSI